MATPGNLGKMDVRTQAFKSAMDCCTAAAAGEASWTEVARQLRTAIGADSAAFIAWRTSDHQLMALEGLGHDAALVREYEVEGYKHDLLLEGARYDNEWQVSDELFPDAQWSKHPFLDLLQRHEVRQVLALTLRLQGGIKAGLTLHRTTRTNTRIADFQSGPLRELTQAASRAFGARYARSTTVLEALEDALTDANAGCLLVDSQRSIVPLFSRAPTGGYGQLQFVDQRLAHRDPATDTRLRIMVLKAAAGVAGAISARGLPGQFLRIEARPVPNAAKLATSQALALVRIVERDANRLPELEDLRSVFGLTPTQAKVLQLLCSGRSTRQCAEQLSCAESTVKSHISNLLYRMNCASQVQLVRVALLLM